MINFKRLKQSFIHAGHGLAYVFRFEQNFKILSLIGLITIILSVYLNLRKSELVIVIFLVFLVIGLELLNTVFEKFLDVIKPRLSYQVGIIKDIMSAIVLFSSLCALIIGLIIFYPYFVQFFN